MVDDNVNSGTKPCGAESGFEGSTSSKPIDIESPDKTESGHTVLPLSGRYTSDVWKHYHRVQIGDDVKAMCNYCELKLVGGPNAGTTHLKGRTKRYPKRICQDIRQTGLFGKQTSPTNMSETLTLTPYEFHQEDGRRDVAEMIVLHEYPLSMVEHYGFRKICKTLQPGFKLPCQNTTRKDIMRRYVGEKENMTDLMMKTKSKISLTTNMWTSSNQKKGYMAVIAHFIDNSWKLQSRILRWRS